MHLFTKKIQQYWQTILLFLIWSLISVFNTKIYWMLIDDGYNIWFVRNLFLNIKNFNITSISDMLFESTGRFRPVYWFYHMIMWLIGKNNFTVHRVGHVIIFGFILVFIYSILTKITKSKNIAFIASLLFLIIPVNFENWARIGSQEPLLTLFSIALVYFLLNKSRYLLVYLTTVLMVFTKETSVAMLPGISFIYLLKNKFISKEKRSRLIYYLFFFIANCSLLILIAYLIRGDYSKNYFFSLSSALTNFFFYLENILKSTQPFLLLALITFFARFISNFKKFTKDNINFYELLFLIFGFSYILLQIPWKYSLERYLFPATVFLCLFLSLEFFQMKGWLERKIKQEKSLCFIKFVFYCYLFYFSFINLVQLIYYQKTYALNISTKYMSQYISDNVSEDYTAFLNLKKEENTYEIFEEMKLHLSEFWGRSDINFKYLDIDTLPKDKFVVLSSNSFIKRYDEIEIEALMKDEPFEITSKDKSLIITTPFNLIKQLAKKIFMRILYGNKFTWEGIYTSYNISDTWYFYNLPSE